MRHPLFIYCTILALVALVSADPIWKVFCPQEPLFRGRADPIVEPGVLSQHSHKVWGGSNFGIGDASATPLEYYYHIRNSSCTTCSITVDLSDYWIPDLYYQWPNGSFSLVPNGGLTIYYLSRSGTAAAGQDHPDFQPFPEGLRMTSGSPTRRNFTGSVADQAIQYLCLDYSNNNNYPQTNSFPTATQTCHDGLRAQVWFPMCWDGKNLDSPNHQSHMSFPLQAPDGGDCPSTHPVRVPGVFFEVLFDINPTNFPHGQGVQPFRWSCGDSTGYGLHGDFLSGWPEDVVYNALHDPDCDLSGPNGKNLASGNNVKACPSLAPYVKDSQPSGACPLAQKVLTIEDLGVGHLMDHMPGCNPVTNGPLAAVACHDAPQPVTLAPGTQRVLLQSVLTGKYLSSWNSSLPIKANISSDNLGYSEVFVVVDQGSGHHSILSEGTEQYLSASSGGNDNTMANRGSPSTWEYFQFVDAGNGTYAIMCFSNNKYLSVQADGTVKNNVATFTDPAQQWNVVNTNSITTSAPPPQNLDSGDQDGNGGYVGNDSGVGKVEATLAVLLGATLLAL